MEQAAKKMFEQTFRNMYFTLLKNGIDQEKSAETAYNMAEMSIQSLTEVSDEVKKQWYLELLFDYKISLSVKKPAVMRECEKKDWYNPTQVSTGFYWSRYREYLSRVKEWPQKVVESIDNSTNEIMYSLGDPNDRQPFDYRGLVLGYVQSGKTANFTGLINKAYDIGYKLVIVLSGIHNDLRAQTQIRLNEEVIGISQDHHGDPIGVAQIVENSPKHLIQSWTTVDRDVTSDSIGVRELNNSTLMVVKKNKTVLESLKEQLIYHKKLFNLDIPVLIIDDEADQASVDTSNPNKDEDPKTINKLIRQILEVFDRKCYVGYTATPFANLLINANGKTDTEGKDLYPKDFLIGLPKPEQYCGPEEFFNVEEDADDPRPSLIRPLRSNDVEVFTGIKKKEDAEKFEKIPPQMKESIMAFLLTIAIRNLRGQTKKHNSMLIHTSRFKDVQSSVKEGVEQAFEYISGQIQYNSVGATVATLRDLYEKDFVETTMQWPEENSSYKWTEVFEELKISSKTVQVFEINGNSKDALDYSLYKNKGLNVIAVGGDKLSRGLTLEGLSITYYFRNTLMYDTLMQMGRWFGYRKGYMDLCRIYTSDDIASNFEHLAIAMIELREEFEKLAASKKTPKEYAVKMLSHPTMTLTNPLKMRNASIANIMYGGTLQQTRMFDIRIQTVMNNMEKTDQFIKKISQQMERKRVGSGKTIYHIAKNINPEDIINYLSGYQTSGSESKVDVSKITNYIKLANDNDELVDWTVALVEGVARDKDLTRYGKFPVNIGGLSLQSAVLRGMNMKAGNYNQNVDIRAIVAAGQEFIDIDPEVKKGVKGKENIRGLRKKENGILLIYPLHPKVEVFDKSNTSFNSNLVPIGFAISFPDSDIDETKVYESNKTIG